MAEEVWQAMHEAERDEAVRVIVLTGAGRAFCAGGDVTGFKGQDDGDFPRSLLHKLPRAYDFSRRPDYQSRAAYFPAIAKPIIAMLNGATAGLGLVHALFADIRIAADDAVHHHGLRAHRPGVRIRHGLGAAQRGRPRQRGATCCCRPARCAARKRCAWGW